MLTVLLSVASAVTLSPGEDWCGAANDAVPGDEIVLLPGDHPGPCSLRTGGADGLPITVRSADPGDPARIVYSGTSSNVIDVYADHLTLRDLAFGPTQANIDAVKVKSGSFTTVEGCTFTGIGGISVSANSADSTGVAVLDSTFLDLQATGLYLGCHEATCVADQVRVEGNLFDGVTSSDVGYGLEVKLDSWGVVRDNVIHDTQGPGIEIFGSEDPARATLVDGNLVVRSRVNGSIEVGGPHVAVTNNVVIGGGDGGIYVYPYWDSVHDVIVAGNTVIGEGASAIRVATEATSIRLSGNAVWQDGGGSPLPSSRAGLSLEANVVCADPGACWVDAEAWDLRPVGDLLAAGVTESALSADFCGVTRGDPPTAGALEGDDGLAGPLAIVKKSTFGCGGETGDTGGGETGDTPDDTGGESGLDDSVSDDTGPDDSGDDTAGDTGPAINPEKSGCGCAAPPGASPPGAVALLLALVPLRRRAPAQGPSPAARPGYTPAP